MMKSSRSEWLAIRGLSSHIRHWGRDGAPKLFMLHGWMDVSASFQFVVDALQGDWHVIAPDWRGFGLSERTHADTYWFPDYVADLDAMLNHYAPGQPVNLLGHSMGGNVASLYAGVRPARVQKLINLEGFGLKASQPQQAPARYAAWLDELAEAPLMQTYPHIEAVAARLQKTNPRLSDARAAFLAQHWSVCNGEGRWEILGDPLHKRANPLLYQLEELLACWSAIEAPVLWVEGAATAILQALGKPQEVRAEVERRLSHLKQVSGHTLADAGHMLHHDQPEALARLIDDFLAVK